MTKSIYFPSEQPKHTLIHKIRTLLSMGESGGMCLFVCVCVCVGGGAIAGPDALSPMVNYK